MKNKIIKHNLIGCIIAAVLAVVVCTLTYLYSFERSMKDQAYSQAMLLKYICQESKMDTSQLLAKIQKEVHGRITFIGLDGTVLFDSQFNSGNMENHASRTEIDRALQQGVGTAKRYSDTASRMTYYCALLVEDMGVIRVGVQSSQVAEGLIWKMGPYIILSLIGIVYLCYRLATATTKRIVNTIESYDLEKGEGQIYDELSHFVTKINRQNKVIAKHMHVLTDEKEKLQSIFENIKEAIVVCDDMQNVVQTNKEAVEIFSIEAGQTIFAQAVRNVELQKAMDQAIGGNTVHGTVAFKERYYQYTVSPNFSNGQCVGAILIVLDITQQLESQNQRRQFTANVTHELKTPLTSIVGYSQLITNHMAKPQDVEKFVKIIENNAIRLLEMIEDIIKISNLEEGVQKEKTLVMLDKVVEKAVNQLNVVAQTNNVTVNTSLKPISLMAVEIQMYELCQNLISNAIKYNNPNGKVEISLAKEKGFAVLKIKDTGIGISQKEKEKIFERFYVVDKSRNKNISSSGLGLAIVKHIVQSHQGQIKLKSTLGQGSVFSVYLPLE